MTDLTDFASLSLPDLTAELERMQATFTPTMASPSRDAPAFPLEPALAGTFSEVA